MAKRHTIPHKQSQRHFTKHATHPHPKNAPQGKPMRGGIRL